MRNKLFYLLGVVILAEVFIRAFKFSRVQESKIVLSSSLWNNSGFSLGPLEPNSQWTAHYNIIPFKVRSNNYGLRSDHDVRLVKKENEFRILMLGDSMTFSEKVHQQHSYPNLVEKYLRKHVASQKLEKEIFVFNAGKPGVGSFYQLTMLKSLYHSLKPDLIVLNFCQNDIQDTRREVEGAFERLNRLQFNQFHLAQDFLRRFAIYQASLEVYVKIIALLQRSEKEVNYAKKIHEKDEEVFKKITNQLLEYVTSKKIPILYTFTPLADLEMNDFAHYNDLATELAKPFQIPYVNGSLYKNNFSDKELTLHPMDGHFSREGNIIFARLVSQKIISMNLIR